MKKILLTAVIALCGLGLANAQEGSFGAGINAALPIGDAGDIANFGIGLEATYLHPVGESLMIGGNIGFMNYFSEDVEFLGSEVEIDDIQFLPIAATAMYMFGDGGFGVGADIGYAVGIDDGNDGGLMYEPKLVYNTESLLFSLGYQGISNDGNSFDSIQLGAIYKF